MPSEPMRSGTLRLLVCCTTPEGDLESAFPLAWEGAPPGAVWADNVLDVELGDYDCAPVPDWTSRGRGLWLLTWPWREIKHPEWKWGGETTARYSKTGEWRRPTVAELAELGLLPIAGGSDAE